MPAPKAVEIIEFWQQAGPQRWFAKDHAFDTEIRSRFESHHHAAARGELADWSAEWTGSLALLLLLDQFPRNIYRGSGHAFATDGLALSIARSAIGQGHDMAAPAQLRGFYYLPFEHSEQIEDQDLCLAYCAALDAVTGGDLSNWAQIHRNIIVRFGRFPHRNAALGRKTTPEEQGFLDGGGFSG